MKYAKLFGMLGMFGVISGANAANITIYHSPSCPHCHNARDFIEQELVYVYDTISVNEINVMDKSNRDQFISTIKKCGYKTGGVPVMVIGEKCFQGYSAAMQNDIRSAVEVGLSAEQKKAAQANKQEFDKDKAAFVANHADRKNAVHQSESKKN